MGQLYATFVLPAPKGCNLHCSFCAIAQRGEAGQAYLAPGDYVRFLADTLVNLKVDRVSIQGFEPLLPEVRPLTAALLKLARNFFCRTSLVTNGVYLAEAVKELRLYTDFVTVSLDSAKAHIHDALRGKAGAHSAAVDGIRMARKCWDGSELVVNTVLLPSRADNLVGMPELLSELGVHSWIISPVIDFKRTRFVSDAQFIRQTIAAYSERASALGITMELSGELRSETDSDFFEQVTMQSLGATDDIFRLSPDGTCSRNEEIWKLSDVAPRWDRTTPAHVFLSDVFTGVGRPLSERSRWVRDPLRLWVEASRRFPV